MILISAGLVLAAVILLIAGFVLAKPFLIMWSIVVSVLSALFLVIGALLRRHELFPGGGQAAVPATPPPAGLVPPGVPDNRTGPLGAQASPQPFQRTAATLHSPGHSPGHPPGPTRGPSPAPASGPPRPVTEKGISPDAIVLVIPGRKRYHVQGCRQLIGRDQEELTYEEAREEGFTPCTACLPDAALGGRQLPPAPDPEPAVATAHQAEPTRDPQSPAVPPKPEAKASIPTSAPSSAEGPTGWFGRPASSPATPAPPPTRPGGGTPSVADGMGDHPSSAPTEHEETEAETKISLPLPDAHRSPKPDRPKQSATGAEQGKSGSSAVRDAPDVGRGAQGERSVGKADHGEPDAGRAGQRSSQAVTAEPDGDSSGPDTRPQPRVTASGTPVSQSSDPSAEPRRPSGSGPRPSGGSASGSGGPSRPGGGKPQGGSAASSDTAVKSPQGGSDRGAASNGAGPSERPASSAESAKSRALPTPTGAPDKATGGRTGTGSESSSKSSGSEPPAGSRPGRQQSAGVKPGGEASTDAAAQGQSTSSTAAASKDRTASGEPASSKGKNGDAKKAGAGMVQVIVGTRRYHGTACPLIRGAGESGVESMTLARAEAAGLTSCSVCQNDRETVG